MVKRIGNTGSRRDGPGERRGRACRDDASLALWAQKTVKRGHVLLCCKAIQKAFAFRGWARHSETDSPISRSFGFVGRPLELVGLFNPRV